MPWDLSSNASLLPLPLTLLCEVILCLQVVWLMEMYISLSCMFISCRWALAKYIFVVIGQHSSQCAIKAIFCAWDSWNKHVWFLVNKECWTQYRPDCICQSNIYISLLSLGESFPAHLCCLRGNLRLRYFFILLAIISDGIILVFAT